MSLEYNSKMSMSESRKLLLNVHKVDKQEIDNNYFATGNYEYYHYVCDGFDDRGWGCGYRTLQTICSWMKYNINDSVPVPSIKDIQQTLVDLEDKPKSFIGSRQWIGSFEVCLVIDKLYNIPCKILHVNKGESLESIVSALRNHFINFGCPVMMGGDIDCSSKGILGVQDNGTRSSLLIVDPHYVGEEKSKEFLQNKGWVKWQPIKDFLSSSFYNLCLPQAKSQSH